MRVVVQRATRASVPVDGRVVAAPGAPGLVVLVGAAVGDGPQDAAQVARRVAGLRILRGERSVLDEGDLRERGLAVSTGVFGADMAVELVDDGPLTILLDTSDARADGYPSQVGTVVAAQGLVVLVLGVAAVALQVWALVEAARLRKEAYPAAGKQTKLLWVAILAVATAIGFVSATGNPLQFLNILSVAAAGGFLAGVRPAVRAAQGRGGRSSGGPYGGW